MLFTLQQLRQMEVKELGWDGHMVSKCSQCENMDYFV